MVRAGVGKLLPLRWGGGAHAMSMIGWKATLADIVIYVRIIVRKIIKSMNICFT